MEEAASSLEGDHPNSEEHLRAIDCPVSVLKNLRASVLERFNSTPHGGTEVSGVLFGTRNGDEVRIRAFCPSASQGGLLQEEGRTEIEREITAVISAARDQKELTDLEPLGWFRAHPRCQLGLTERDVAIANALFAQLWQVVLVMRPGNSAATRVCFYFRDREGPWTADCAVREFTLPAEELEPGREFPDERARAGDTALVPAEFRAPLSALMKRPERRRMPGFPAMAVMVAVATAMAGGVYYWFARPQPLGLRIRATDSGALVRVAWDATARPVRNARAAYVEIEDGGQSERVDLEPEQLQIGYVNHQRHSNQVTARMVVIGDGSTPREEVTQYIAPPGTPPVAEPAQDQAASESAVGTPEKTPELVVPVPVETREPAAEPAVPRPKFQPPVAQPARSPVMEEAPAPVPAAPTQVARGAPATLVTPQVHVEPPPPERVKLTPASPAAAAAAPAPAQNAALPAVTPRAPAAPLAGRLIWIGRLQRNQQVTITGKSSSTGTLIGELPGRPFKFSISPGDLTNDGIVLYTSNMQYANSVVEPPGVLNGWNKTVYTWNPKFASDVTIDEVPAEQNGWNRMVLRNKNPKISVIVIDWTALN